MRQGGRIRDSDIEEVRERTDIVQLISEYVPLKKSGREFRGPCPFHAEKDPSFYVNPAKGVYYCFGCKASGGVYNFLMKMEGLTFNETVEKLAERIGFRLTYDRIDPEEEKERSIRERIFQLNRLAAEFYHHQLVGGDAGDKAQAYLDSRGIGEGLVRDFMIGYAPGGWSNLCEFLLKKGFSEREIVTAGLAKPRQRAGTSERSIYDIFRKRVIFPIFDNRGRIVAFGGRRLEGEAGEDEPKYINSPETPVYRKGRVLYGFYQAKNSIQARGEVIVVEGYTDLLSLVSAGFPFVVATLGTALTEQHFSIIGKFCDRIYLAFDSDRAGLEAARKVVDFWEKFRLETFVVSLPEGEDPASMVEKGMAGNFKDALSRSEGIFDFAIRQTIRSYDISSPVGKTRAVEACMPYLLKVSSDELRLLRDDILRKLSGLLDLPRETIAYYVRQASRRAGPQKLSAERPGLKGLSERIEREALRILLHDPEALLDNSYLDGDYFEDEDNKKIFEMLKEILAHGEEDIRAGYPKMISRMIDSIENEELREKVTRLFIESPPEWKDGAGTEKVFERLNYMFFKRMKRRLEFEISRVDRKLEPKKYEVLCDQLIEIDQVIKYQFPYEHD